jgi:hypothetical protein
MFGFSKKQLLIVLALMLVAVKFKATITKLPVVGPLVA